MRNRRARIWNVAWSDTAGQVTTEVSDLPAFDAVDEFEGLVRKSSRRTRWSWFLLNGRSRFAVTENHVSRCTLANVWIDTEREARRVFQHARLLAPPETGHSRPVKSSKRLPDCQHRPNQTTPMPSLPVQLVAMSRAFMDCDTASNSVARTLQVVRSHFCRGAPIRPSAPTAAVVSVRTPTHSRRAAHQKLSVNVLCCRSALNTRARHHATDTHVRVEPQRLSRSNSQRKCAEGHQRRLSDARACCAASPFPKSPDYAAQYQLQFLRAGYYDQQLQSGLTRDQVVLRCCLRIALPSRCCQAGWSSKGKTDWLPKLTRPPLNETTREEWNWMRSPNVFCDDETMEAAPSSSTSKSQRALLPS